MLRGDCHGLHFVFQFVERGFELCGGVEISHLTGSLDALFVNSRSLFSLAQLTIVTREHIVGWNVIRGLGAKLFELAGRLEEVFFLRVFEPDRISGETIGRVLFEKRL